MPQKTDQKDEKTSWFYYMGRVIVRILLLLFTNWQVIGKENIPREGSLIVVANHLNLADPPILGVCIPRKMIIMAKQELFRPRFTGYFIKGFGAFPVRKNQLDREALRQSDRVLKSGMALAMFPEGTRSSNAQLQSGLPGSALVAARSGASILPVGITGTENIRGKAWLFKRPRITINIGHPFKLPAVEGKINRDQLNSHTDFIMRQISRLLPPNYRGIYHQDMTPEGAVVGD